MKVAYLSDIHAEFLNYPNLHADKGGDILLLAGDIFTANMVAPHRTDADSKKLKKWLNGPFKEFTSKYDQVLYVFGNHEHYNSIYKNTHLGIMKFLQSNGFNNVFVMENDYIDIDGVRFIGATLWTDYNKGNPLTMEIVERGMNDYKMIGLHDVSDMNYFNRRHNRKINPQFLLDVHLESVSYIYEKAHDTDLPVVVLTHHAPSFQSVDPDHVSGGPYGYDSLNGAYASDLSSVILDSPNIKFWVHGHTHHTIDYPIGQCRILSNQRGYSFEACARHFEGTKSFEIGS